MKKNRLNISTRAVRFMGISACLVFSLAFISLAGFSYFRYSDAQRQFKQKQAYLLRLKNDAQNLRQLLRNYKEERERFSRLLFSDRDIATFLEEFGEFAKIAKVRIADMKVRKFQDVKPEGEIKGGSRFKGDASKKKKKQEGFSLCSMPIKIVAQGNFEHIVDFLVFLERYRQLLTLSDLSIRRRKYPLLESFFTLRLYSLKRLEEMEKQ